MSRRPAAATNAWGGFSSRLVRGEGEVLRLALRARDLHVCALRPELLMPGFDRVRPGRQTADREAAVGAGHGVERIGPNADVRVHPAVHVAFELDHHFGRGERTR